MGLRLVSLKYNTASLTIQFFCERAVIFLWTALIKCFCVQEKMRGRNRSSETTDFQKWTLKDIMGYYNWGLIFIVLAIIYMIPKVSQPGENTSLPLYLIYRHRTLQSATWSFQRL